MKQVLEKSFELPSESVSRGSDINMFTLSETLEIQCSSWVKAKKAKCTAYRPPYSG